MEDGAPSADPPPPSSRNVLEGFRHALSLVGYQAILRSRMPRSRKDLEDLRSTADVIFPGGSNPRLEELVTTVSPRWEILELHTRRAHYG